MPKYLWSGEDWVDEALIPRQPRKGPMIITDSHEGFKSQADGRFYTSKSAYRRSLREHGMIEVGNEMPQERVFEPQNVRQDIKTAIEQVKAGKGAKDVPRAELEQSISTGKTVV